MPTPRRARAPAARADRHEAERPQLKFLSSHGAATAPPSRSLRAFISCAPRPMAFFTSSSALITRIVLSSAS
eukprot:1523641-Pyramimonas_sp.AAC.1